MRKNDSEGTTSPSRPSRLRCAIYTRKSTEEGLEQEFNSLDAQRTAGGWLGEKAPAAKPYFFFLACERSDAMGARSFFGRQKQHNCPAINRTESIGWRNRVNRLGSRVAGVPVKWAFSQKASRRPRVRAPFLYAVAGRLRRGAGSHGTSPPEADSKWRGDRSLRGSGPGMSFLSELITSLSALISSPRRSTLPCRG